MTRAGRSAAKRATTAGEQRQGSSPAGRRISSPHVRSVTILAVSNSRVGMTFLSRAVLSDNRNHEKEPQLSMPADTVPPFIAEVVHPTDLSPASERAFAHALAIALVRRARLIILHVAADDRPDWGEFPAVRGTLERWGLLERGSSRECALRTIRRRGDQAHDPGLFSGAGRRRLPRRVSGRSAGRGDRGTRRRRAMVARFGGRGDGQAFENDDPVRARRTPREASSRWTTAHSRSTTC